MGEVPIAIVVPRIAGSTIAVDSLRDHCRARLPAYAVPTRFELADTLPRTEAGKLRRADLREGYALRG